MYAKQEVVIAEEPKVVLIEVKIDWTEERIKEEIRNTFPENPNTAIAIAKCESGLKMVRARAILDYGREESYGVMQIHAKVHHKTALSHGLDDYQTDIAENVAMGRIVSNGAVARGLHMFQPWTCFKSGEYKKHL